jgi:quinol monooxygenase YgiN
MTDTPAIHLIAHLVAKPGQEQALIDAVLAIVPAVLREPGCIAYVPHVSTERPGTVVMYEVWENQAAIDAHAAGPNLGALSARFDTLLAEPLRLEPLRRLDDVAVHIPG